MFPFFGCFSSPPTLFTNPAGSSLLSTNEKKSNLPLLVESPHRLKQPAATPILQPANPHPHQSQCHLVESPELLIQPTATPILQPANPHPRQSQCHPNLSSRSILINNSMRQRMNSVKSTRKLVILKKLILGANVLVSYPKSFFQ